jgi:hypothetical protein
VEAVGRFPQGAGFQRSRGTGDSASPRRGAPGRPGNAKGRQDPRTCRAY